VQNGTTKRARELSRNGSGAKRRAGSFIEIGGDHHAFHVDARRTAMEREEIEQIISPRSLSITSLPQKGRGT